jgi:hypothetical protein
MYKEDGETKHKACAAVVLTERAAGRIIEKGIMLLLSYDNEDRIRLALFWSMADPPMNVGGRCD